MKRLVLLAALLLPLAAQAQDENARFRYLGIADNFAVMATTPEGPPRERKLVLIAVDRDAAGPGGADTLWAEIVIDCPARTNQFHSAILYLGDKELQRASGAGEKSVPESNTPFSVIQDFACKDWKPEGEPVWINGAEAARHHARDKIKAR